MFSEPSFLQIHQIIDLAFVSNGLILAFKEAGNIVSKQVVRDYKCFLTFLALLTSVGKTVRIVVILAWRSNQDSALLQRDQVVNVIWHLV